MSYTQIVAPGLSLPFADGRYAALSHSHPASAIVSGVLALARGGTNADLSATGGSTSFLRQVSSGATISVGGIVSADLTTALTTPPAIGGTTPGIVGASLLTVTGNTNAVQLTVRANATQSNTNSLVRLVTSAGGELLSLHSDNAANVFLGAGAGRVNNISGVGSEGLNNTFIGSDAGLSNTTGFNNSAQGRNALLSNTTGGQNTAQGMNALFFNTTGSNNTAQGVDVLRSNTIGSDNSAQGFSALRSNTTGGQNTAQGVVALFSNTTGGQNTAQGFSVLYSNTTGFNNSAQGKSALYSNTTGFNNSAQGMNALLSNTTGSNNTAQGVDVLYSNTIGSDNSAQGFSALLSNTTGSNNTAQGMNALFSNTTGPNNSAQGFSAGRYIADGVTVNSTGGTSLYLGADTKALANGGANQIVIGFNATGVGSNSVVLGNSSIATTVLRGNVGIGTTAPSASFHVVNTTAGNLSSVVTGRIISRNDSGTPAVGFGSATLLQLKSSTTVDQNAAVEETLWSVATDASRMGQRRFGVYDVSTVRYGVDMVAVSGGVQLGFYGVTPVSRAALAANASDLATAVTLVNDIKAKFISLGLVS